MQLAARQWVCLFTMLLGACSAPAEADRESAGGFNTGGAAWAEVSSDASNQAGAADVPPLTEAELRRLLDALEREIDQR